MIAAALIVFSGKPGVGKSTIARVLAKSHDAMLLRVDSIESAMAHVDPDALIGNEGYMIAAAITRDALCLNRSVIVDAVNDDRWCHELWTDLAMQTGHPLLPVEVTCSDPAAHRERVEKRQSDLPGQKLPDWDAARGRFIIPWSVPTLRIDSASQSPEYAARLVAQALNQL